MKSIDLTKLSLAAPPKLRDLVMNPASRDQAQAVCLAAAGPKAGSRRVAQLVGAGTQLVAALGIAELLCVVDGNQDEQSARPWVEGLPGKRDRTRSLIGRLLRELGEGQNFAGLIRLGDEDISLWLPALARRAVKYQLPATLCMSKEPPVLVSFTPAGVICCYSPEPSVLERIAELAPSIGLTPTELR